jgi:hypothetical protein
MYIGTFTLRSDPGALLSALDACAIHVREAVV